MIHISACPTDLIRAIPEHHNTANHSDGDILWGPSMGIKRWHLKNEWTGARFCFVRFVWFVILLSERACFILGII